MTFSKIIKTTYGDVCVVIIYDHANKLFHVVQHTMFKLGIGYCINTDIVMVCCLTHCQERFDSYGQDEAEDFAKATADNEKAYLN